MADIGKFIANLPSVVSTDISGSSLFVVEQQSTSVTSQITSWELVKYCFNNITASNYVNGASYKNLPINIGGTIYYIPVYTAAQ